MVADIVACFFDKMKQLGRRDLKRLSTAYEVVLKRLSISYRNFANEYFFGWILTENIDRIFDNI